MPGVDLNNSPDLSMEQITKQLFNNEIMSDIQFRVEGKLLYAHSWELMKRSIVFREQFRSNLGDNKLIPIEGVTYKAFYEFLRFIYTDELDIGEQMKIEMLRLAVQYKIIKLENIVLHMTCSLETDLKYLEFSVVDGYDLIFRGCLDIISANLHSVIKLDRFLVLPSSVVELILKSDRVSPQLKEIELLNKLVDWVNLTQRQIHLTQRRIVFEHFLQFIRFAHITRDEFIQSSQNHPNLFSSEIVSIIHDRIQIVKSEENRSTNYLDTFTYALFPSDRKWETKFTVSYNLILHGLKYGVDSNDFEVHIFRKHRNGRTKVLSFKFGGTPKPIKTISFGESIKLIPNVDYTVEIIYRCRPTVQVAYRNPNIDLFIVGPSDAVTFTETSNNLFEIFFKLPDDECCEF